MSNEKLIQKKKFQRVLKNKLDKQITIQLSKLITQRKFKDKNKVNVANKNISSIGVMKIDDIIISEKITTLWLGNNFLTTVQGIGQFKNLIQLSVANNMINTLSDLNPLSNCKYLSHLYLSGNMVCNLPNYRQHILSI
eukprot:UN33855